MKTGDGFEDAAELFVALSSVLHLLVELRLELNFDIVTVLV